MEKKKRRRASSKKVAEMLYRMKLESGKKVSFMHENQINQGEFKITASKMANTELSIRQVYSKGYFVGFWFQGKKWHTFDNFENIKQATEFYDRLWEYGYPERVRHRIYDYFFLSEDLDYSNATTVFGRMLRALERFMDDGMTYIDELKYDKMMTLSNVGAKTWWLYGKLLHDGKLGHLMENE